METVMEQTRAARAMQIKNPFVTQGYAGAEYFCGRAEETRRMTELLANGNNLALISPRRLGKTALIHHCFAQPELQRDCCTFIADIGSTRSVSDMVSLFGKAIIDGLRPLARAEREKFLRALPSVRSQISFDIDGLPVWSRGPGAAASPEAALGEIFACLAQADRPCLVAVDGFQQIASYGDRRAEALLRTYVQRCANAHFVFSGSRPHLMGEMFASPSRPFYQSSALMSLEPLDEAEYREFAREKFEERGKRLEEEVTIELFRRFGGVTACIQRVMNILFFMTPPGGTCAVGMIGEAVSRHLDGAGDAYEELLRQLPERQRNVFLAVSAEGEARQVTSGAFAARHGLGSPSSVNSAVKGLLEKGFIAREGDALAVDDRFFGLWIKSRSSFAR